MTTTYSELIRQTMLKLQPRSDGITRLAVEQTINDAQRVIACIRDFDELKTLDITHALTKILTSGAIALTFGTHSITRVTGSFITDGFTAGSVIKTNATLNPGPFFAETVEALTIVVTETLVTEVTTACTMTASKKSYHIEDDLDLVRPKDIYSIRLMDQANSRKLIFVPLSELDSRIPYTELTGTGRSVYYTVRGRYIELYPIPDIAYHLYIQHSQWPTLLSNNTDETDYLYIDHVIVALAVDMALASLEGGSGDWFLRAKQLLGVSLNEDETRPDQFYVAQPFEPARRWPLGKYWLNPWVKHQP